MKTIITLAAVAAAVATASVASAHDRAGGHYEWRDAPAAGPRAIPHRVRLWVSDQPTRMASCKCSMMPAAQSSCMIDKSGKGRSSAAG